MSGKECAKRKKCSLRAFSLFPTVFSKDLDCKHIKNKTRLKAFADDKLTVTKMIVSAFDRVENCGNRRNCLHKQFLLFPQCFHRLLSQTRQKVSLCGNGLNIFKRNVSKLFKCERA